MIDPKGLINRPRNLSGPVIKIGNNEFSWFELGVIAFLLQSVLHGNGRRGRRWFK
ncbi:MAG: hypothetical protein JSS51_03995 [Planctomycetes bacterium]|nr:hypothetical protein [Planctomycetota bacterium]